MRKMNTPNKTALSALLLRSIVPFLLACLGVVIAAAINGIHPFGENTILFSDLSKEYMPFLTELWDKIHSGDGILYSFRTALGGPFIGNIFYYISSPLNLLALFAKREHIQDIIMLLIMIRCGFASMNMSLFLSHKPYKRGAFAVACGILYALCGWFAAYYYHTIWLDVFMLIPLLAWGTENIIDKYDPRMYAAVLIFMLFSNFYMSYLACIFAIIYWIYYYFSNHTFWDGAEGKNFFKTRFFKAGSIFAVSSVLSALMLGAVFVPLLLQLSKNNANEEVSSMAALFGNLSEQISAMLSGSAANSNMFEDYANIYSGILPLAVIPLIIFNNELSVKEKLTDIIPIIFLVLSFNVSFLDLIWHGFRYPTCFPFRESFIFTFFVLTATYKQLCTVKRYRKKRLRYRRRCFYCCAYLPR